MKIDFRFDSESSQKQRIPTRGIVPVLALTRGLSSQMNDCYFTTMDTMYVSKMEYGAPNGYQSGGTRSQSISIRRNSAHSNRSESFIDRTSYDMATWRMYNRIIRHRQSRFELSGEHSSCVDDVSPRSPRLLSNVHESGNPTRIGFATDRTACHIQEEGLFDLEL